MKVVVSDTSPIRALVHLARMNILSLLYEEVIIPPAVVNELLHPRGNHRPIDAAEYPVLRVVQPSESPSVKSLASRLGAGETQAIALALEVGADELLIDEKKGRAIAKRLGLETVGVLALLVRAKRERLLDEVKPLMDRLQKELRFYISSSLYADVLRRAGEC